MKYAKNQLPTQSQVENTEIPAHRNVLACVSPYLMDLFSAEQVVIKFLMNFNCIEAYDK